MLKALELVGFKSFADKTRFEFPPGITVVVGPNGSGKSNVVDAIKWVLGEQSVKSLRGKEMADVIFNGSGSRPPQHAAETTLTFDNSSRMLAIDAPEVHITRRVYRSGEGEYLINRQPSRLRDIKELFAGTGLGTDAYSIIEQGRVDALLQSSPKDRRVVFEEAAGISRFKAKKIESLRRLERVDQNLLRLKDIVDEVENRLRSIRLQAGKARRYKELTDRLQELRTQIGLADWRQLSERLNDLDAAVLSLREQAAAGQAEVSRVESESLDLEAALAEENEAVRVGEAALAESRQRMAGLDATIEHQRATCRDLDAEIARHRRQLTVMSLRAGDVAQQLQETSEAAAAAEDDVRQMSWQLSQDEHLLGELNRQLEMLRGENERRRGEYLAQLRSASTLGNQIGGLESQTIAAAEAEERLRRRDAESGKALSELAAQLGALHRRQQTLGAAADESRSAADGARGEIAQLRRVHAQQVAELSELKQRQRGAAERASLLAELEQRQEGLGPGVKEVLARAKVETRGPLKQVLGVVAELFHVNVETAPLIDAALGDVTGHVVIAPGDEIIGYLQREAPKFPGRVGFVKLEVVSSVPDRVEFDLDGRPGVLGRADRFVETAPEFSRLAKRLLGRTWVVETLADAVDLAEMHGKQLRFVTLAGEVLSGDGTLIAGPRLSSTGLISRRSELRELERQLRELAEQIDRQSKRTDEAETQVVAADEQLRRFDAAAQQAAAELAAYRLEIKAVEDRQSQLVLQHDGLTREIAASTAEHQKCSLTLESSRRELQDIEGQLELMDGEIAAAGRRLLELDDRRQTQSRQTVTARVELAKREERLGNLRGQLRQAETDQQERRRGIDDNRQQFSQCVRRLAQAELSALHAEMQQADVCLVKESRAAEAALLVERRERNRGRRSALTQHAARSREELRQTQEQLHAKELAAGEVRLERNTLANRLRDDYAIEIAELEHVPNDDELRARQEVEQEIAELRRKINNIGNVNLEALGELEQLEARFATLSTQYQDLASAKQSLEQIIHKINADSRRLFAETLETVRGHFQELFRKLFGGGQADIVLEEGVDILDSGIDIVARPPGKEPRNISLLSGGEKTLTCAAMLLAIFRSRPSPFCVLDEVDAALDEANIERFVGVLKEFLAWTQFVVVTHSKKTMACASTLYGVTMEESGVSKRVAVRFEDVSDNGEIRTQPTSPNAKKASDEQAA